jgi:hypothetical protein
MMVKSNVYFSGWEGCSSFQAPSYTAILIGNFVYLQASNRIDIKPKRWLTKNSTDSLVPARRSLFSEGGEMLRSRRDCHCTTTS